MTKVQLFPVDEQKHKKNNVPVESSNPCNPLDLFILGGHMAGI